MIQTQTGRIIKALSGFFYVAYDEKTVECRARGKLRQEENAPIVGDYVRFSEAEGKGMVEEILPRANFFIRPAVANIDLLVIFASAVIPVTDPFLIDRVAAIAGNQNVPVLICINKSDLDEGNALHKIYQNAGFDVLTTSAVTGDGIDLLREKISGKLVAFSGNSGVGKSSVLNALSADLSIQTAEVSQKLGRGKHTTRHVELYRLSGDTLVADTPGFSSFDTDRMDLVVKENLQFAFSDFAPFLGHCQFHDCAHLKEPGCAVRAALGDGMIEASRYDSYVRLYEKAKEIKPWELKQT